jgi:hypothetical protein
MPWKPLLQAPNRTTIALIRIKTLNKLASIAEDLALTKSKTEQIQFVTRIANWMHHFLQENPSSEVKKHYIWDWQKAVGKYVAEI